MAKYKYLIELTQEYRQFEVVTDYQYPNEGEAILTEQYGGREKCRVSFRGATEEPQSAQSASIERYKYLVELPKESRQFEVINDFKYPNEGEAALVAQYGGKDNCRVSYRGSVTGAAAIAGGNPSSQQNSSRATQSGGAEDSDKKRAPTGDSALLGLHAAILAFQTGFRKSGLGGAFSALTNREAEREAKHQIWSNKNHKSLRALAKKGIDPKPPTTLAPETEGVSAFSWMVVGLILLGLIGALNSFMGGDTAKQGNTVAQQTSTTKQAPQQFDMDIEGEVITKDGLGAVPYRSQSTGDLRLFYFSLNTPVAKQLLDACPSESFCELSVLVKTFEGVPSKELIVSAGDVSGTYEILAIKNIKRIQ